MSNPVKNIIEYLRNGIDKEIDKDISLMLGNHESEVLALHKLQQRLPGLICELEKIIAELKELAAQ